MLANKASQAMPDQQAIRDLMSAWHQATAAGDVPAILRLMDDDVVFLVAGQEPMRGKAAFAAGLESVLQDYRVQSSGTIQEIAVAGDLAYSWAYLTVTITNRVDGQSHRRAGHVLTVLRRQNGSWVVLRDANLLTPFDANAAGQ